MNKCKNGCIREKPPETHNAQGWFGFVIKTFFLYRDADEKNSHECQQHTSRRVEARRAVKRIDGDAQ